MEAAYKAVIGSKSLRETSRIYMYNVLIGTLRRVNGSVALG